MIKGCKICGIKDSDTLSYIINHPYPPKFIGFICNYQKSSRYVELNSLKKLLNVEKNKSKFVAVLVKPNNEILEDIKSLPFDYYQLYDCTPETIKNIKQKYQKRIITALTIKYESDVLRHKLFSHVTDMYLFDSKGYEKSEAFDHNLILDIEINKEFLRPSRNQTLVGNTTKAKKIFKFANKTNIEEIISIKMDNDLNIEKNG